MSKYEIEHARHDPAHCLTPGLFRSLKRGDRKNKKLDVTYQFSADETMRFIGFEPLGADDMRLLQGVVALGGPHGLILTHEPDSLTGKRLRKNLDIDGAISQHDGLVIRQSIGALLNAIGITNTGENIKALKASLTRMANVSTVVTRGNQEASFHLMSYVIDEGDGKLWIALNPRITEAILGNRPHARIDMREVRALQTDPARLIHQRLCGWVDVGKKRKIELDTLCTYVWPEPTENINTLKTRRQTVRKALTELANIGWSISEYAKGKFDIQRPRSTN